jgi:RimJ/RimL family protein N-acetyltransferase
VGWRLIKRAWHRGYATEAGSAAVNVAFNGIGLDEIWSMTAVLNEPSQAVMTRLGLTLYGHFEHPRVPEGHQLRPHVVFRRQRGETASPEPKPGSSLGAEG